MSKNNRAVGTLYTDGGKFYINTLEGVSVPALDYFPIGCRVGDRVSATLGADGVYSVDASFGSAAEIVPNINAILSAEGLDGSFEADAAIEAKETAFAEISALMAHRVDFRGKTILTLSKSEKSRAECGFSLERDKAGNFILGLHTVDAVEFIDENSALEKAVFSRGKTVVIPSKEIPMLPDAISKGPCFLEVGEDRLAVSYMLTINAEGEVLGFDFCESIIKTAANCLFDEIEALLFNFEPSSIFPLRQAYSSVQPILMEMFELGGILQNARISRGGASIDRAKRVFKHTFGSKAIGVSADKKSDIECLVREFLAVSGVELARYLNRNGIPAIYRVQNAPDDDAIASFCEKAKAIGYLPEGVADSKALSMAAELSHLTPREELLLEVLHDALPPAYFAAEPLRHPVHATDMYVRFAYPINRCADFCMQKIVKEVISARENNREIPKAKLADIVARGIESATYCENRAGRVEDAVENLVALECLERSGDKTYSGYVKSVGKDELCLLLDNNCIAYAKLAGDKEYSFGDFVKVGFASVDFEANKLYVTL